MLTQTTKNLKKVLESSAEKFAERPALSYVDSKSITYKEFYEKVIKISDFLRSQDISIGDRFAILSENMPNWVVAYFAITTIGAIVVPILPDFHNNKPFEKTPTQKTKRYLYVNQ